MYIIEISSASSLCCWGTKLKKSQECTNKTHCSIFKEKQNKQQESQHTKSNGHRTNIRGFWWSIKVCSQNLSEVFQPSLVFWRCFANGFLKLFFLRRMWYCICFDGKVAAIQKYGKGVCFLQVGFFQKEVERSILPRALLFFNNCLHLHKPPWFWNLNLKGDVFPLWSLPFTLFFSLLNKVAITFEGTLNWVVFLRHVVFLAWMSVVLTSRKGSHLCILLPWLFVFNTALQK